MVYHKKEASQFWLASFYALFSKYASFSISCQNSTVHAAM
jgi:hypothetical protein